MFAHLGVIFRILIYALLLYKAWQFRDWKVGAIAVLLLIGAYSLSVGNHILEEASANPFAALLVYTMVEEMQTHNQVRNYRKVIKGLRREVNETAR